MYRNTNTTNTQMLDSDSSANATHYDNISTDLNAEIEYALQLCFELHYSTEIKKRVANATCYGDIERALMQGRMAM